MNPFLHFRLNDSTFGQISAVSSKKPKPKKKPAVKKTKPKPKPKPVKKVTPKKTTTKTTTNKATNKKVIKPQKVTVKKISGKNAVSTTLQENQAIVRADNNGNVQPVKSGGGITSSIFGLISQYIAGNSRNQTIQTADGSIPFYNNLTAGGGQYETNQIDFDPSQLQNLGAGASVGSTLGGGFDGLFEWGRQNLGLVALFAGGMYLLFRQPPQYGNRR